MGQSQHHHFIREGNQGSRVLCDIDRHSLRRQGRKVIKEPRDLIPWHHLNACHPPDPPERRSRDEAACGWAEPSVGMKKSGRHQNTARRLDAVEGVVRP